MFVSTAGRCIFKVIGFGFKTVVVRVAELRPRAADEYQRRIFRNPTIWVLFVRENRVNMAYGMQPQSDPTAVMGRRIAAYALDGLLTLGVMSRCWR